MTLRRLFSPRRAIAASPSRFILQWHITDRCDHHCAHCYQNSILSDDPSYEALQEIHQKGLIFWDAWRRLNGHDAVSGHFSITGGEPFLHQDLMRLLDRVVRNSPRAGLSILTNGGRLDAQLAGRLSSYGLAYLQVSMEGAEPTHDAIRGSGDHARVMRSLLHARNAGLRTYVSFTAGKKNYRDFPYVAEAARRSGTHRVWSDRYLPIGSIDHADKDNVLSPSETREFFELMHLSKQSRPFGQSTKTEMMMHRALQFRVAGGRPYSCQAGSRLLAIMPNGDIYPCRRLPIKVGNMFEDALETIYFENPLLRALRDPLRIPDDCGHCCYRLHCRGGLKCLAYAMTGEMFAKDPGCWNPA